MGLCGIAASGKSTLAVRLVRLINEMTNGVPALPDQPSFSSEIATYIGLDGWHYTRATLDTFDDPKDAHDRRGAPFTFDGEGYVKFVKRLHGRKV